MFQTRSSRGRRRNTLRVSQPHAEVRRHIIEHMPQIPDCTVELVLVRPVRKAPGILGVTVRCRIGGQKK